MPKKIDPKVKERCVQQMLDHVSEYPSPTAAAEAVALLRQWFRLRSAAEKIGRLALDMVMLMMGARSTGVETRRRAS